MRTRWILVLAGMLGSLGVCALSAQNVELFGGYSFAARDFSGGTIGSSALHEGWNASLNLKFNRVAGFVSDVGTHYNHESGLCAGALTSCSSRVYTFMFGPQFSLPLPKLSPFAHALVGLAHASQNGTIPPDPYLSNNSFIAALGGGLDYHLTRHLGLRAEGDYLLTRFTYSDNQLHFNNNNARISAGVVVRF